MIDQATALQSKAAKQRFAGLLLLLAIAAMLAAIVANAFMSSSERRQAEARQRHSLEILLHAGEMESAINSTLRGERGYLITHDKTFLDPYISGRQRSIALLQQLRTLTRDNRVQQSNLDRLGGQLETYHVVLARLIGYEEAGMHDVAVREIRSGIGRRHITEVLKTVEQVEAEERRLLALRSARSQSAEAATQRYNYAIAAAAFLLVLGLAFALRKAGRAHRRALALTSELHNIAQTDALTGLANRRQFLHALDEEMARAARSDRTLSLALLDIDHFKSINDNHGHPAGDAALRGVADILAEAARETDLLARVGGEEFALLLPDTDSNAALHASERLRVAIENVRVDVGNGQNLSITLSSGVSTLAKGENAAKLMARADAALYAAKQAGRNQVKMAA